MNRIGDCYQDYVSDGMTYLSQNPPYPHGVRKDTERIEREPGDALFYIDAPTELPRLPFDNLDI
jgi:hypothetical protein